MTLIRLDGPKGDPILNDQCEVVGTYLGEPIEGELQDGDWVRETSGVSVSEHRWYAPVDSDPPTPAPQPSKSELLAKIQELLAAVAALPD